MDRERNEKGEGESEPPDFRVFSCSRIRRLRSARKSSWNHAGNALVVFFAFMLPYLMTPSM
jgi:hypothetical protein